MNVNTPKPPAGTFRCNSRHGYLTSPYINHGKTSYTFTNTGETRQIKHHITNCDSTNLTYMIQCKRCKKQYIGETKRTLRERFKEHIDRHQTIHSRQTPQQQSLPTLIDINLATRSQTWNFNIPLALQPTLSMSRRKAREA